MPMAVNTDLLMDDDMTSFKKSVEHKTKDCIQRLIEKMYGDNVA